MLKENKIYQIRIIFALQKIFLEFPGKTIDNLFCGNQDDKT